MLASFGDTQVLCTASIEERVPAWMRNTGRGWVTGEYGMLPRATHTRSGREASRGKQGGRTVEIQRLIGRSLRAVTDLERTVRTVEFEPYLAAQTASSNRHGLFPMAIGCGSVIRPERGCQWFGRSMRLVRVGSIRYIAQR